MVPVLILAHSNLEGIQKRISELRSIGVQDIYIFLDGSDIHTRFSAKRDLLEDYLNIQVAAKVIKSLNVSDINLGVGIAMPSALDWFFSQVNQGLILEDDCHVLESTSLIFRAIDELSLHNSIVCLSNPRPVEQVSSLKFHQSPFFSSWGWICTEKIWKENRVTHIALKHVWDSIRSMSQLSFGRRMLLAIAWSDVWWSLRRNQDKLWAFRFSVKLISSATPILYPSFKAVQHEPSGLGDNVKKIPPWDLNPFSPVSQYYLKDEIRFFEDKSLTDYIAANVHGADAYGLILRFGFRLAKLAGLR